MNATLISQTDASLGVDYKQFIRQFESYRQQHPEYSFQQAMDTFLALQKSVETSPSK